MTGRELQKQKLQEAFKDKKIGLALSGGGHRAAVFHLGVLSYLADNELLENINHVSTVSGGSILMGLIYKLNNYEFPNSNIYLNKILPEIKGYFTDMSLSKLLLNKMISNLRFFNRHSILASELRDTWGIDKSIQDIADKPIWTINTTVLETGKSWRIQKKEMKEYKLSGIKKPNISISDAIAASAGFPIGIGPMKLDILKYQFKPKGLDQNKPLHLYDGGLYDNLGLEVFMKNNFAYLDKTVDFVISSDASKPLEIVNHRWYYQRIFRIIDVSTEQIRSLKVRLFHKFLYHNPTKGVHIRIGEEHYNMDKEAKIANNYATNFNKMTLEDFDAIKANGYVTAEAVLTKYYEKLDHE
jgi:NTE family protein